MPTDPGLTSAVPSAVVPGAIAAAREALGPDVVADLASLPFSYPHDGTLICHGSPLSDVRSFAPDAAEDDEELLDGTQAARVVFGHTHLPFARMTANGTALVNPGSVGMPFDGDPRAAYALLTDDGRIEHRRVRYDHAASATQVRGLGGGWADVVARRIERATMDVSASTGG